MWLNIGISYGLRYLLLFNGVNKVKAIIKDHLGNYKILFNKVEEFSTSCDLKGNRKMYKNTLQVRNKKSFGSKPFLLLPMLLRTMLATSIVLTSALANIALAEEAKLQPDHPTRYYVKNGDTLWGISQVFLQNPWAWPEIWHINEQVTDPHLIYPGDEISLVYLPTKQGKQKPAIMVTKRNPDVNIVKLSPKKRAYKITSTIPTLPLAKVESFIKQNRVVDKVVFNESPYVLAADNRRIVVGKGDVVYVRGDWENPERAYNIFRGGKPYIDPDTKEVLGYEAINLGLARFISSEEEIATFKLVRTSNAVREYDILLSTDSSRIEANFFPKAPSEDIKGEIIRVFSGVFNIGQYDMVVINRGSREGVEKGDVFAVMRQGMIVRDKKDRQQKMQLPNEKAGLLMVFKVSNKVSFGLILKATGSMRLGDKVQRP